MNATAELWLISDFPIDADQLAEVRKLYGENTTDADLQFRSDRKICGWPLRPRYESGTVSEAYFLVYLCAGFLIQRRKVVDTLHKKV